MYAKKRPTYSEWHCGQNNHRMLKKAVQQGRSERRGESYPCGTLSLFVKRERRWRTFSASFQTELALPIDRNACDLLEFSQPMLSVHEGLEILKLKSS